MQTIAIFCKGGQGRIMSTRLSFLEILRELGQNLVDDEYWLRLRSRLDAWVTPEAIPVIIVRSQQSLTPGPEDTVELWWNGGIQECYRLEELATFFKVAT